MHVHARLPGRASDIHADVVAVGRMLALDAAPRVIQEREHRCLLVGGHVEEVGHMALRHYEHMAAAQRMVIAPDIGERILCHHILQGAELAGHRFAM